MTNARVELWRAGQLVDWRVCKSPEQARRLAHLINITYDGLRAAAIY